MAKMQVRQAIPVPTVKPAVMVARVASVVWVARRVRLVGRAATPVLRVLTVMAVMVA
jgi:hypothetical protein